MELLQLLINGLSLGGIYAMMAIGLALIFSVMGFLNFAYADLLTICGYTMFFVLGIDAPFGVAVCAGILMAGFASVLMERIAFRPLRNADPTILLLTSFAISAAIHVSFQIGISARPKPIRVPAFLTQNIEIGPLFVGVLQTLTFVVAVVSLIVVHMVLTRTKFGLTIRAAASDFSVARLMGIRANMVFAGAFAISGILAGIAGVLYVCNRGSVDPLMSLNPLIKALIAAIIGGTGSLVGAVLGGFLLGFLEVAMQAILPAQMQIFRDPLVLSILVAFLLFQPHGITGTREEPSR